MTVEILSVACEKGLLFYEYCSLYVLKCFCIRCIEMPHMISTKLFSSLHKSVF